MNALPKTLAAALIALAVAMPSTAIAATSEPTRAQESALERAASSARSVIERASSVTTRFVISLDQHARDAKRMLVRLDRGYPLPVVPDTRICVRNQRILLEYRF